MPRSADRICQQNEQDPSRVAHTRQEAGSNDFLAVGLALHILQLNMEGLSAAECSIIRDIEERHNITFICIKKLMLTPMVQAIFLLVDLISSATHFMPNMTYRHACRTANKLMQSSRQQSVFLCTSVVHQTLADC